VTTKTVEVDAELFDMLLEAVVDAQYQIEGLEEDKQALQSDLDYEGQRADDLEFEVSDLQAQVEDLEAQIA
jgi:peptidoglycan hydrolase CwlO-like protein